MGVRGLQTYLEQYCPSASQFVSVPELLKRRKTSGDQPIIVVDGLSTIHILYDNLDWIGGCQTKELVEKAEQFVNAFKKIGVRLVFFFDGVTQKKKRNVWVERRLNTLDLIHHVLDAISGGERSCYIDRSKYFIKPAGMTQFLRDIFQILCGCEVYQSLGECDEEIAEYARSHGAFAILGQDTDFVILDKGEALYLSMNNLNLQTLRTRQYDGAALAKSLGIQLSQLPLLATFMGNDVIPARDLKSFHNQGSYRSTSYTVLFPRIATYIRTLSNNEGLLLNKLPAVSQTVLGSSSRANEILTSIRSYSSLPKKDYDQEDREASKNDQWTELVIEARRRHVNNTFPDMIYGIMKELTLESGNVMEDTRKKDLPVFAIANLPIRKRMYGILLQEKVLQSGKEHQIEEWCMAGPSSLDGPHFVTPEPPPRKHPGLMALWGSDEKYSDVRWQLFVHSVSPKLDVNQLRSIPAHMVFPTIIIFYIADYLDPWEADAILATAATIQYYSTNELKKLSSDPLLTRGIRLANLYVKTVASLNTLLAACGYPLSKEETLLLNFFDGKLFQDKYRTAKSGVSHSTL